jgi:predicted PurR-regulated permease PerM
MASDQEQSHEQAAGRALEVGIRLAAVAALVVWSFRILLPFLSTIIWALIIAAALHPAYLWLLEKFRRGAGLTSLVFTATILVALMTPVLMLSGTLVDTAKTYATELEDGSLKVPPPPERAREWPVIGERLYDTWLAANQNLDATLHKFEEQIKGAGHWLIETAAGAGLGILQFAVALIISGVFLAHAEGGAEFARDLGRRLAGPRGERVANTASSTVQSVARGVLGVAIIQAVGAGLAMIIIDLPGAGLWTLLVLMLAIVQLPTALVLIPTIFYVASVVDIVPAVIYGIWVTLVAFSDNILKPLLLGRGSTAPMAVIFLGAIGGFIVSGIVGLFVGAVILVLSYKMFLLWLYADRPDKLPEDLR